MHDILDIQILPDNYFSGKMHICCIYLFEWYKKDIKKTSRKFYYSFKTLEDLYKWTITLNFLSVKAIHDDFCFKYGTLYLPMNHEVIKDKGKTRKKINFKPREKNHNSITVFKAANINPETNTKRRSTAFVMRYSANENFNQEVKNLFLFIFNFLEKNKFC